jgi:hypothetical protein
VSLSHAMSLTFDGQHACNYSRCHGPLRRMRITSAPLARTGFAASSTISPRSPSMQYVHDGCYHLRFGIETRAPGGPLPAAVLRSAGTNLEWGHMWQVRQGRCDGLGVQTVTLLGMSAAGDVRLSERRR